MAVVKKTIMIPWDFSPVSELAFQHAVILKKGLVDMTIVHIVDKEIDIKQKSEELNKIAEECATKYNVEKPNVVVKKGNIFK
ncbi:MAG: universal stress protein, partial [Bacteroidota bacterium]